MIPRKIAAPFLCFAFYMGNIVEAAALASIRPSGAHLDARRGATESSASSRNGTSVHIPSYMMSLYRTLSVLDPRRANGSLARARRQANTVTSFIDQGKDEPLTKSYHRYIFDLSGLSRTEELVEAELRVLRRPPSDLGRLMSQGGSLYRLVLYSCSPPGSSDKLLQLASKTVDILDATSPTWDVFEVGASVRAHRKVHRTAHSGSSLVCFSIAVISDSTNEAVYPPLLGLGRDGHLLQEERALLVAFSRARRKENLFKEIREKMKAMQGGSSQMPRFELSVEGSGRPRRRRRRRTALSGRSGGAGGGGGGGGGTGGGGKGGGRRRTRCSRKTLHVNFKELGWDDWIIAPLDYEAYHCEGVCDFPLRSHLEPTNHAIIQTLMNSMDPEVTPPSCCVPSKLSPISILYIDSGNNVVYKQYEDMVVESCGCR